MGTCMEGVGGAFSCSCVPGWTGVPPRAQLSGRMHVHDRSSPARLRTVAPVPGARTLSLSSGSDPASFRDELSDPVPVSSTPGLLLWSMATANVFIACVGGTQCLLQGQHATGVHPATASSPTRTPAAPLLSSRSTPPAAAPRITPRTVPQLAAAPPLPHSTTSPAQRISRPPRCTASRWTAGTPSASQSHSGGPPATAPRMRRRRSWNALPHLRQQL